MSKEVAHEVESILRGLITSFDSSSPDDQVFINKIKDAKMFLSSLDAARKAKGLPNHFQILDMEDENALD
jgi:hypothetical protein